MTPYQTLYTFASYLSLVFYLKNRVFLEWATVETLENYMLNP
jgi:hypothetical protein